MGLDSARAALSEPMFGGQCRFLAGGCQPVRIFVSDENDYSRDPVNDYLMHFEISKTMPHIRTMAWSTSARSSAIRSLPTKANRHVSRMTVWLTSALATWLATRTDGAVESICDDDFSPIANWDDGLGIRGRFILSGLPDESSMKVKIYGDAEETSLIGELEKDVDYSYVVARNGAIQVDQIPPSEAYVLVEYRVLAEGSQIVSDTGEVAHDGWMVSRLRTMWVWSSFCSAPAIPLRWNVQTMTVAALVKPVSRGCAQQRVRQLLPMCHGRALCGGPVWRMCGRCGLLRRFGLQL